MSETEKKATAQEATEGQKTGRLPLKELVKRIGPGMILTGVIVGPGSITTAAVIGARFGYQLMWLLIVVAVMNVSFVLANYRLSLLTGKPCITVIRENFGAIPAIICGIAAALSGAAWTISNITGTGMGVSLLIPVNWQAGAVIMVIICFVFMFLKGAYKWVERAITVCVLAMLVCFLIAVIASGGPDWSSFFKGLVTPQFPEGSLATALGLVSTSATITAGMYGTYLGKEKNWKLADMSNGIAVTDTASHALSVSLISLLIMMTGAIVLNPQSVVISSPAELANLLRPALGGAAPIVMGVSIIGAAFSSLLGTSQRTAVLALDGIGLPYGLDKPLTKIVGACVILIGLVVALIYGKQPVQLILTAQIATAVATPLSGIFIILALFKKKINGSEKRPAVLLGFVIASYLVALGLTINTVIGLF